MKATGEVMGIGSNLQECLLKSVRSLEIGVDHFHMDQFARMDDGELWDYVREFRSDTIFAIVELLRRGASIAKLHEVTMVTEYFLEIFKSIVEMEHRLAEHPGDVEVLREAKQMGFADSVIARLWQTDELSVNAKRHQAGIIPVFRMVDTLKSGAYVPYFYSSFTGQNDSKLTDRKKVIVLGAGPIRIGQGVEFDYSSVHAIKTIREAGYEAIIINDNPETVSTDYTTADKLY